VRFEQQRLCPWITCAYERTCERDIPRPTRAAAGGEGVALKIERRRQQSPRTGLATDAVEAKTLEKLVVEAVSILIGGIDVDGFSHDRSSRAMARRSVWRRNTESGGS